MNQSINYYYQRTSSVHCILNQTHCQELIAFQCWFWWTQSALQQAGVYWSEQFDNHYIDMSSFCIVQFPICLLDLSQLQMMTSELVLLKHRVTIQMELKSKSKSINNNQNKNHQNIPLIIGTPKLSVIRMVNKPGILVISDFISFFTS